jgi:prephenate dehydratase
MAVASAATSPANCIAFQGASGAYGDLACRTAYPNMATLPCDTFEETFNAAREGRAALAMIAIDNSLAGRVADVHHLMPESGLHIVGEHFQRVVHHLLAPKGATLQTIKTVHSHVHALPQCRKIINELGLKAVVHADTAGAAADVAKAGDVTQAAIASELAGQIYGLVSLRGDVADGKHNTTRFVVMRREPLDPDPAAGQIITSFVFRVRSVPAALYKALGGFATNGVNMSKLESYMVEGQFTATQFYAEVDGHPDDQGLKNAMEELTFFSKELRVIGVYPAHPYRQEAQRSAS